MADSDGVISVERKGDKLPAKTVQLDRQTIRIGRLPDNHLVLELPPVAAHHAEISWNPNGYFLTDLGSKEGTILDGRPLKANQPSQIKPGDTIKISDYTLNFDLQEAQPIESTPKPDLPPPLPIPEPPTISTHPMLGPVDSRSTYLKYLPSIYEQGNFLGRYLLIFEHLWEPLEWRLDHMSMYFNPATAPSSMVNWLGQWLGLPYDPEWSEGRRRDLVANAMNILRFRGTPQSLARVIELCTGITPSVENDPDQPYVFKVRMLLPPSHAGVSREFVKQLIETHKPAHTAYILEMQQA